MLRKRKRFSDDGDEDPMSGISNLSDAMLVLALGFLIFAIMALQVNPDMMAKTQESQAQQAASQVSTGEDFTSNASAGSSLEQSGFSEVGKVYKDPDTGKLVMVQGWRIIFLFFIFFILFLILFFYFIFSVLFFLILLLKHFWILWLLTYSQYICNCSFFRKDNMKRRILNFYFNPYYLKKGIKRNLRIKIRNIRIYLNLESN